jgi:hypothetical protein
VRACLRLLACPQDDVQNTVFTVAGEKTFYLAKADEAYKQALRANIASDGFDRALDIRPSDPHHRSHRMYPDIISSFNAYHLYPGDILSFPSTYLHEVVSKPGTVMWSITHSERPDRRVTPPVAYSLRW